jgi:hypothetical protein
VQIVVGSKVLLLQAAYFAAIVCCADDLVLQLTPLAACQNAA